MPHLLLIEDNEANQDLTARYLRLFEYEVTIAGCGDLGLAAARNAAEMWSAILLDMNLPDIDGWEVARRLKTSEATREIPLIALTAHAMAGDREKTLAAGCDDYASKPVDFPRLLGQLQTLLNKAAAV